MDSGCRLCLGNRKLQLLKATHEACFSSEGFVESRLLPIHPEHGFSVKCAEAMFLVASGDYLACGDCHPLEAVHAGLITDYGLRATQICTEYVQ